MTRDIKKIAFISMMAGAPWGGSEELWKAGAARALGEGYEVIASVHEWPAHPPQIRDLIEHGASVVKRNNPVPWSGRLQKAWMHLRSPFQELQRFEPDVVCLSQGGTFDIADDDILYDAFSNLVRNIPYTVICQLNDDRLIPNEQIRTRTASLFSRAEAVIFVAHTNLRIAKRQLTNELPNAVVLQNPVNLNDTSPVAWPSRSRFSLASVARLEAKYKGQDLLLEALSDELWKSRDWILNVFGTGPDDTYLHELAEYYGLTSRIRFHGHVTDIRSIWASNHLLLLPSRAEGTPLTLIEAMLCARPALVTDVGDCGEWVIDGETGFVARFPTTTAISDALERVWHSRERLRSLGQKARRSVAERRTADPGTALLQVLVG